MKKLLRAAMCAALAALLTVPALAADRDTPPDREGDINVMVNGQYVVFPDAAPQIKEERSCLPFAAVFQQLGFPQKDMRWDNDARTVTAVKDGGSIVLTIGERDIVLNGKTVSADMAPYIDPATDRTYVSSGTVSDALGYNVGWDASEKTVIIDDVDAILAANDATYSLMDQYLEYTRSFYETNQRVAGNYAAGFALDTAAGGESAKMAMDMDGRYDMLMSGATAFQFNTDMTLNAAAEADGKDVSQEELGMAFPMDVDMEMRGDFKDGVLYLQSKALSGMLTEEAGSAVTGLENMWYKLDLKALFDEMSDLTGMDYATFVELSLSSMDQSFEESLAGVLKAFSPVSADMTTSDALALYNAMLSDSAFTKSGSSYVNTMELPGLEDFADSSMTFTFPTSGGKVNGCVMEMSIELPESMGSMAMTYGLKGREMEMSLDFDMLLADVSSEDAFKLTLSMTMEMDGTYRETKEQPAVLPPEGAVVADLNALIPSPL